MKKISTMFLWGAVIISAVLSFDFSGADVACAQSYEMGAPGGGPRGSAEEKGQRGRLTIDYKKKIDFLAKSRKYFLAGDTSEAMYYVNYAIEYGFDTYESYLLLADIYRSMDQDCDEEKTLEFVSRYAPNERLKNENEKRLSGVRKKIRDAAIRDAAREVSGRPESLSKVIRLGATFSEFDDDGSAMEQYKYLEASGGGKFKSSFYAQVRLLLSRGKLAEAKPAVKKYFALEPDDTQMVYLLASKGINLGESKELGYNGGGRLDMRKFNRTYSEFYYRNGYRQYLNENYESALHSFEYALEYFMTIPKARKLLGDIYYKRGMFRESIGNLKIAYEFLNTDYEVGVLLARAYIQLNMKKEARFVLAELLKYDNNKNKYYYDLLAKTGLRKRQIEKLGYVDPDAPPRKVRPPAPPDPASGFSPISPLLYDPSRLPAGQQVPYTISPTGGTSYPPPQPIPVQ